MMRALLIACGLLVLANIGLMLWPDSASGALHIYAPAKQVNAHFIRLNNEIEQEYLAVQPGGINDIDLPQRSNSDCYRLGPFVHQANYELAQAVLYNAEIEYQKSARTTSQSQVFRVFLGPYDTQAAALEQRRELLRINIPDNFVRAQTDNRFIVSLGIYSTQASANTAMVLFSEKLSGVKVQPEQLVLPSTYWLHFALNQGDQMVPQLASMDWGTTSIKMGLFECKSE